MDEEIELKFLDVDVERLKSSLGAAGAVLEYEGEIHTTTFTGNGYAEDDSDSKYLRVRTTPKGTKITFKGPAKDGEAHIRDEAELGVDDHEEAVELLKRLGFTDRIHDNRYRAHYRLDDCCVDIDDWRIIPAFCEIEAPSEERLRECATSLGLEYEKGRRGLIAELYPGAFER